MGGIGLECTLLEGGSAKCVHMRAEGGRGSKKAKKLRAHYMDGPLGYLHNQTYYEW